MHPLIYIPPIVFVVVLILQLPLVSWQIAGLSCPYAFIASDGQFEFFGMTCKGKGIQMKEVNYSAYNVKVNDARLQLFRKSKINPLKLGCGVSICFTPDGNIPRLHLNWKGSKYKMS